jgi:hypothetical protein
VPSDTGASGPIGPISDGVWQRRIVESVEASSRHSYQTGCRAFDRFCALHHIHPLFQLDTVDQDVLVLVTFIDWLFNERHLQPGTVQGNIAGVKNYFETSTAIPSPALGGRGHYHPLIALALQSLSHAKSTVPSLPERMPFTEAMLVRGQQLWPPAIYAIVVLLRAFLLRTGEVLPEGRKFGPHALRWQDVSFMDQNHDVLPQNQWSSTLAASAGITFTSRKWQNRVVREIPRRTRLFYPASGSVLEGLGRAANGCAVATLQAYYVLTGASTQPFTTYLARQADGSFMPADDVRTALREVSREFHLPDHAIGIHSLKHAASSVITDAHMTDEEGRMAAGFKDQATLRVYNPPGIRLSDRLSQVLLLHDKEEA